MAWRGRRRLPYFGRVRDVIERVLEKKNEAEAQAADAFLNLVPDAMDTFAEQGDKKDKRKPAATIKNVKNKEVNNLSWKDDRTHYEKASSRVGPEFQVDELPVAGSYSTSDTYGGDDM